MFTAKVRFFGRWLSSKRRPWQLFQIRCGDKVLWVSRAFLGWTKEAVALLLVLDRLGRPYISENLPDLEMILEPLGVLIAYTYLLLLGAGYFLGRRLLRVLCRLTSQYVAEEDPVRLRRVLSKSNIEERESALINLMADLKLRTVHSLASELARTHETRGSG